MSNEIKAIVDSRNTIDTSVAVYNILTPGGNGIATYPNQFLLQILENGSIKSLCGYLDYGITTVFELIEYQNKKEIFYITAVDNLLKKNDFLQLTIQLDQELISEEEFEEELQRNECKYLIKTNSAFDKNDFKVVTDILLKFDRKFTGDDASELFSIPLENINSLLDSSVVKENP